MNKKRTVSKRRPSKKNKLMFRLYVAPGEASSSRALSNLRTICSAYFGRNCQIEVIDTLKDPLSAEKDEIAETPTLIKLFPEPTWRVIGDLSEDALVLAAMKRPRQRRSYHKLPSSESTECLSC